jgi:hypothetical protein
VLEFKQENPLRFVGCCGAYCKTCKVFIQKFCRGCKLGYTEGDRDINKAKCLMKVCCFKEKKLEFCGDCPDYKQCKIIHDFYNKNGYKYKKYRQSLEFIQNKGYDEFLRLAERWKGAYGKLI